MSNKYEELVIRDYKKFIIPGIVVLTIISLTIIGFFGIRYYLDSNSSSSDVFLGIIRNKTSESNGLETPRFGNLESNISLVYIYDLQCPACKGGNVNMTKIYDEYKNDIRFVYKNFPLPIHSFSKPAAYALMSVYKQKPELYFEYKDIIFEKQEQLNSEVIDNVAKNFDINYDQWNNDKNSKEVRDFIDNEVSDVEDLVLEPSQYETGNRILATPSIILIKDNSIVTWWSGDAGYEETKSRIDSNIK